jgi:parallel beta-helix repeat protein
MQRMVLLAVTVIAVTIASVSPVATAQAPTADSVVANGFNPGELFLSLDARSGPAGENATGRLVFHIGGGFGPTYTADVTCLGVAGGTAVIGFLGTVSFAGSVDPAAGLLRLTDAGGPGSGEDIFEGPAPLPTTTPPSDCSTFPTGSGDRFSVFANPPDDIVVTDATALQCGQVITQDVRLDSDLTCPPASNGLIIGADGVTVDLNGHVISSTSPMPSGIAIGNAGHDRVTIRDGTITGGFAAGVVLTESSHNRLVDLAVRGGGGETIRIEGGRRNSITGSDVFGRFIAIGVEGSDHVRIVGNTVSGFFASDAMSIRASFAVVARNTTGATGTGSLFIDGSSNRIVGNEVRNGGLAGIGVFGGSGNLLARNGTSASFDGIFVGSSATDTILRRDLASGNADDGIDVESPSTILIRNTANDNGDLGIEAVPGVFAIANRAAGNGNPLQCLNVVCR